MALVTPPAYEGRLAEAADSKGPDFGDAGIVAVDVHNPKPMMDSRFSDQQVWDRGAVPHSVVMSEVALEHERPLQQVMWSGHDLETGVQLVLQLVVMARRAGGVELLELTHKADEQLSGQLGELGADAGIGATSRSTLVQDPACYRHISSEASTSMSTCRASRLR